MTTQTAHPKHGIEQSAASIEAAAKAAIYTWELLPVEGRREFNCSFNKPS